MSSSQLICPKCSHRWNANGTTVESLRRRCQDEGWFVYPDDTVDVHVAAIILDRAPGTLGNWRRGDKGPRFTKHGRTGRVRYYLADIAELLDKDSATVGNG